MTYGRKFQSGITGRCSENPKPSDGSDVGDYRFLSR